MNTVILFILLVVFLLCLALSAFFSSSEAAFISLQRVRLAGLLEKKVPGAELVDRMTKRPEKLLSTILLGNNLVNTAAASIGAYLAISLLGSGGLVLATVIVTALLLVFGETTPKMVATRHAESLSIRFAPTLGLLSWLFYPFVFILSSIASFFSRLFGGKTVGHSLAIEEEIRAMISMGRRDGTVEEHEAKMLHRVFEFGDRPAREVMAPRPDVIAVEQGTPLCDFLEVYGEHPFSRFPVYRDNMDNVVGILSIKDVLMAMSKGKASEESTVDVLVRPAYFAPESKPIHELFREMRDKNFHMCIVVDEYGGTSGVVSLGRLIEEVVGDVGDELANLEKEYEVINEYTFQLDGSMRIEEANEKMGLNLPEGDYETVAGFILGYLKHIPRLNEQFWYRGMKLVITEMRSVKIERVMVTKETQAASGSRLPAPDR